jgi:hypothetical protein
MSSLDAGRFGGWFAGFGQPLRGSGKASSIEDIRVDPVVAIAASYGELKQQEVGDVLTV